MMSFVTRRLVAALPLLLGVLSIIFLLVEAAPGGPYQMDAGPGVSKEAAARLREIYGAGRPLWERYLEWLAGFLSFDLGVSFSFRQPVATLLRDAAGNTFCLAGAAWALQFLLGTSAGVLSVWTPRRSIDRGIRAVATVLYSVPSFWLGLVLVWILSVRLGWFPASQMHSVDASELGALDRLLDVARHLLLPCLGLALPSAAGVALYVREQLRAVLGQPFVQIARARGASKREILLRHGLRNALLPVVNLLGVSLPGLLGGSVVMEVLFAWPGMGRLAYQAALARDTPLILGCAWIGTLTVICGSLAADLLSGALDPRLREESS